MTDASTLRALLETKPCQWCGRDIERQPGHFPHLWKKVRFCSKSCGSHWLADSRKASPAEVLERRSRQSGDCIEWTGRLDAHGYGTVTFRRRKVRVHRLAYEYVYGPIPAGLHVCHSCDNRRCVKIEHLFLGTNADNIADRNTKARQARGETHARAKLTADDVRTIRQSEASNVALAAAYGVGETTINNVRHRRTWKHV